jgi:hypothetical protein
MPKFVGAIDVNGAYTLPTADGSADQVLTTNGSGTVTFADAAGGGASVTISDSAPGSPSAGNLWFESDTGKTFIYYGDGSSNQWVEIGGASGIAGGSDHHVQFNNVGSLSGSSNFTFDGSTAELTGTLNISGDNDITDFTADNHGMLSLYNSDGAVDDFTCLDFIGNGTQAAARIGMKYTGSGSELLFGTSNNYGNGITRASLKVNFDGRIAIRDDAEAGVITNRLLTVRTQTANMTGLLSWAEYDVSAANGTAGIFMLGDNGDSTNPDTGDYWLLFRRGNGTTIGSVRGTGSASVNFSTTSDQTMKNDLGDAGDVGSIIDAMDIHKYTWKDAAEVGEQIGVFAQEVLEISEMPNGIATPSETRKEENEEGVEEDVYYPAGIDYGKLVPLLVQEIKSLRQRVASLEA